MNPSRKRIALERMYILVKTAISNARSDPNLAEKQANLARSCLLYTSDAADE